MGTHCLGETKITRELMGPWGVGPCPFLWLSILLMEPQILRRNFWGRVC
jgi:hypothetical protein